MIKFIGFDIWEGVTIEDNEKNFTCRTLEIKSTDYSALRIFEHGKNFYMLISKMVYCCELEFEIKEISKSLYLQLQRHGYRVERINKRIRLIETRIFDAVESKNSDIIDKSIDIKILLNKTAIKYKDMIENILKESRLVIN
ncbi:hypothetical protein [Clostridium sp. VAP52]|uniref:hypothetical protein n=1 Tax=Clostridium sp. VAP52 TaxID=2949977 RepID=UPI00207A2666|nr:hypothetical protein [Clostridium sp. VAP52]